MTEIANIKKLREKGRRRAREIVAAQDTSTLENWRRQIEIGWQQAQRGEVVDGPTALAEIRERLRAKRRSAP